jgi:hypothetical protein
MFWKIKVFILRLLEFFIRWPYRFFKFISWLFFIDRPYGRFVFIRWPIILFLKFIDLTPFPLFIETFLDILKWHTRPLTAEEKKLLQNIFGNAIWYSLVGLDANSWPVKKGKAMAYVSLHTINFQKNIPDSTLVHEMTHIWQYKKHGSGYIIEALYAQRWGGGYQYGGDEALLKNKDHGLMAFNFEQQAEIIEDYFKNSGTRDAFNSFISEIRNS